MNKLIKDLVDAAGMVVGNQVKDCPNSMAVPDDIVGLCVAIAAIENIKPVVTNLIEAVEMLLEFIEENDVQDEMCNDGDGYIDTYRSSQFESLIVYAQKKIKEIKEV